MKLLLQAAGIAQIVLALLHLYFPKRFRWKEEAALMSRLNEQIFHVHTFFVCLVLVLFGLLSLFLPSELLRGDLLARSVSGGISFFWFCRFFAQLFVYDSALWRGRTLETTMHFFFIFFWSGLSTIYALPVFFSGGES